MGEKKNAYRVLMWKPGGETAWKTLVRDERNVVKLS
jgi:hypothetical protein